MVADAPRAAGDVDVRHGNDGVFKVRDADLHGRPAFGIAGTLEVHVFDHGFAVLDVQTVGAADVYRAVLYGHAAAVAAYAVARAAGQGKTVQFQRAVAQIRIRRGVVADDGADRTRGGDILRDQCARPVIERVVAVGDDRDVLQIHLAADLVEEGRGADLVQGGVLHRQIRRGAFVIDGVTGAAFHADALQHGRAAVIEKIVFAVVQAAVRHFQRAVRIVV